MVEVEFKIEEQYFTMGVFLDKRQKKNLKELLFSDVTWGLYFFFWLILMIYGILILI